MPTMPPAATPAPVAASKPAMATEILTAPGKPAMAPRS